MKRRDFLLFAPVAVTAARAAGDSVRGTLTKSGAGKPAVKTRDGRLVELIGDNPTMLVLSDQRLAGADFEAVGQRKSPDVLEIAPIHTRAMFVHKAGKRLAVSYWCDICYIRTWAPGKCWCCQEETRLDPVDPATLDDKSSK
ncbi:MAG TPA: hypothetical protein VFL57_14000 [Bryobacteraceae bacterium]|nr:hypothetical protein [Bryobacteraceae bacterium]